MEAPFHKGLFCYFDSLSYDAQQKAGVLNMPAGNCCNMPGCIALFEAIDPEVNEINTFSGGVLDTCYRRMPGQWEALRV